MRASSTELMRGGWHLTTVLQQPKRSYYSKIAISLPPQKEHGLHAEVLDNKSLNFLQASDNKRQSMSEDSSLDMSTKTEPTIWSRAV